MRIARVELGAQTTYYEILKGAEGEAKEIVPIEKPDINFSNVGGMESVKEEIKKAIVYPFEKPELYKMYGKKAGEGIIFQTRCVIVWVVDRYQIAYTIESMGKKSGIAGKSTAPQHILP